MGTYNSVEAEVQQRLGNRGDIASRLPIWINDAYFELLMEPEFTFNELDLKVDFSTVIGQREYLISTIASDLWFILGLKDTTNEREIRRTHWKIFDRIAATDGQPFRYTRFGTSLVLDPTPDAVQTVTLRYRKRPNEVAAGSSFIFGREWEEILTVKAVRKGYEALEQQEKAVQTLNLETALIDQRKDIVVLEDEDNEHGAIVRIDPFGGGVRF